MSGKGRRKERVHKGKCRCEPNFRRGRSYSTASTAPGKRKERAKRPRRKCRCGRMISAIPGERLKEEILSIGGGERKRKKEKQERMLGARAL